MPEQDYPDIYADGFSVTVTPVSAILTLTRVQPSGEPGKHQDPHEIVGRVRVPPAMAQAIASAFTQMAAQVAALKATEASAKH